MFSRLEFKGDTEGPILWIQNLFEELLTPQTHHGRGSDESLDA